jgi:antitoxin ParD1/3/4
MPVRTTRNVSLTPELDAFVDGQVTSGQYRTASEVVRAALRLLQSEGQRPAVRRQKLPLGRGDDARRS